LLIIIKTIYSLQGRVKILTGGKSPRAAWQTWCNSGADSIVWMKEEPLMKYVFLSMKSRVPE
jgi:hypothetical protein